MNTAARAAADLAAALGYELGQVAEVVITPTELTVRGFKVDVQGRKYIEPGTADAARFEDIYQLSWAKEPVA